MKSAGTTEPDDGQPDDGQPDEGRWVRIATLQDPVQARMLRELLENAGIPCATPGAEHRATLGLIGAYVSIAVQVPEQHRDEATRLYDAFVRPGLDSKTPRADPGDSKEASGPTRIKRVAVFVAIWAGGIGAGHLYAREGYAALVLFLAQSAAAISLCAGGPPSLAVGGVLVWLYDVVGSVSAVDRANRGQPRSTGASVAITLAFVVALQALAYPITTMLEHVPPPRPSPLVPLPDPGHEGGTGSPTGLPITRPF